ncbi:S-layer homology domain-containing protein (plasmid) [Paenibacillus sp. S-38]|uniref:S-layer homology domain-containing protein n=1 Tax=Paenibacillus sp. S-38 TaxID=3416710 RepID=UPI003CE92E72
MPAQYPFGGANDRYKKRLFVESGFEYKEVNCRIIEPYSPPTPQPSLKEIRIINAPSHIQQMGIASYKATLTLLFKDKASYNEYLAFCGWTHKFYDEKGALFLGSMESMKPATVWTYNNVDAEQDRGRGYKVEVELLLIKKDGYDRKHRFEYQDIEEHWAKTDIEQMADMGLVTVVSVDGTPVLYFRPEAYITRAEFIAFVNRTRRFLERMLRE